MSDTTTGRGPGPAQRLPPPTGDTDRLGDGRVRDIRVVVADDHPIVVQGLVAVLQATPGLALAGTATSGRQAVAITLDRNPDVVVMDLRMPDLDGLEATRRITAARPGTAVLVLTMHDDDVSVDRALAAGARGFLRKGASYGEIVRALHDVATGAAVFGEGVSQRVLGRLTGTASRTLPELTEREREILRLLAQGSGTHHIAAQLCIGAKTVRNHVSNIIHKLDVPDRAQAIALARQAGLHQQP